MQTKYKIEIINSCKNILKISKIHDGFHNVEKSYSFIRMNKPNLDEIKSLRNCT